MQSIRKSGICLLLFAAVTSAVAQPAPSSVDLDSLAVSLTGGGRTNLEKAENVLRTLSRTFSWLSTDYKKRNVQEIIARGGGNCFELAVVYMDLIKRLNIRHRSVAEVNIHPVTPRRQESAEQRVKEVGFRASVFGLQHNDHRWVEVYDDATDLWVPADPSMGVIGLDEWLKARVWFGERKTIDTSITNDMLVPIGILVVGEKQSYAEDRSGYYLVTGFDRVYGGKLSKLSSWEEWREGIRTIGPDIRAAFRGEKNLHDQAHQIRALWETFQRLRKESMRVSDRQE